jgi:hypothetical protein
VSVDILLSILCLAFIALDVWRIILQRRHWRLYQSALAQIKSNYQAELDAHEKVNRRFNLIVYVAGICVGAFCVWIFFKYWRS